MFNIFEGNADAKARKLQERLEILKRAREDGFFDEERIEPIPEIVADGHGPDDTVRPSPFVKKEADVEQPQPEEQPHPNAPESEGIMAVLPREAPPIHPHRPQQWCPQCDNMTTHLTYGMGTPVWHCATCCACDWCMETKKRQVQQGGLPKTLEGMDERVRAWEQVAKGHDALHEALTTPVDQLFFCTKCGAGLRCGVCNNEATGRYCDLCGKKDTGEGFCTDCWKEEDSDG